jgi:hypothetical protein
LTTSFTDLTTVFDDENDAEDLGISSIDIDFNSSQAPLVTINFIDVRGSAIFQNDINLTNGRNKYASFFELPYPLYELTIKGYYGKPVKYCLHMTRFSSRFNSKTGNFEITGSFIGYTYAMLSDMLMGYLKVISRTQIGSDIYDEINSARQSNVLKVNELITALSFLNNEIEKTSALSENSKAVTEIDNKLSILTEIEQAILELGQTIESKSFEFSIRDRYPLILRSDVSVENQLSSFQLSTQQKEEINQENNALIIQPSIPVAESANVNFDSQITQIENIRANTISDEENIELQVKNYIDKINNLITQYKENTNQPQINESVFLVNTPQYSFNNLTKSEFDISLRTDETDSVLRTKLSQAPDSVLNDGRTVFEYKVNQYSEILFRDYQDLPNDKPFTLYDMTYAYETINDLKEVLSLNKETALLLLTSEIDKNIIEKLGISPTVRNIVEVFTTAVEVFMKSIYRVSVKAEKSIERKNELRKIFNNTQSGLNNTDLVSSDDNIYPWPEYVENSEQGFVEKYLGTVFKEKNLNISLVPELEFIEDLFNAFIKDEEEFQRLSNELIKQYNNWIPVNPLDTSIFVTESPYERLGNNKTDIDLLIGTILTRAMTFLNYTNRALTDTEVQQMATYEANLIATLPDNLVKSALANKSVQQLLTATIKVDGNNVKVLNEGTANYEYNLIFNNNSTKILPINYKPLEEWDINKEYDSAETNNTFRSGNVYNQKENTFLTNDGLFENNGGLYVQILSNTQYDSEKKPLIEKVNTESVIILEKLKGVTETEIQNLTSDLNSAGFNPFGGPYGIQEFSIMDYGEEDLNGLPLKYVFYGDSLVNGLSKSFNNGLMVDFSNETETFNTSDFTFPFDGQDEFPITVYDDEKNFFDGRKDEFINYGKNRNLYNNIESGVGKNVAYKFLNQEVWSKTLESQFIRNNSFSLFGSLWYYGQTNEFTKALLFLNTLPFNNRILESNDFDNQSPTTENFINVTIESPEILRLFDQRAGFIKTPRLWVAYVGGILWRAEEENDVIEWTKTLTGGNEISITPFVNINNFYPQKDEYFRILTTSIITAGAPTGKVKVNPILLNLPVQVKEEFKRVFFDFVTGSDANVYTSWPTIKNKLEIWDGSLTDLRDKFNSLYENIDNLTVGDFSEFKNLENYNIVTLNKKYKGLTNFAAQKFTMVLELYGNYSTVSRSNPSEPSVPRILIDAMMEEVVIANNNYKIWEKDYNVQPIIIIREKLESYLGTITSLLSAQFQDPKSQEKQIQQQIFGTDNQDVIKLQLYRTCKNIYDKWVGGVENENKLLYQCGQSDTPNRRTKDSLLANQKGYLENSLISSFRFVSRSFQDIGDKFYINPLPIVDLIRTNPNASFYDVISGLLADNNFDFIALPTYIDYSNDKELGNLFTPYPKYEEAIADGICGPSFVCVYVGQKSKNLDFNNNKDSYYSNDGFDIRCNEQSITSTLPTDFTTDVNTYEDPVSVFAVNFSQQNQNIFKDITLDQNEFTETAESLKITDNIANKGNQNNVTLAGQNIYNVYSVRSYKAEVEMMGNAMIQPMMYFQLNNIPMFHGAYLITHVKHSIKPNHMSTNFTGVRVKKAETPLLPAADLYMSLLQGLNLAGTDNVTNGASSTSNYVTKYYSDLIVNLPLETIIEGSIIPNKNELTSRALSEISNWQNGAISENEAVEFLDVYAQATPGFSGADFGSDRTPWSAAFTSYVMLAGDPNFPKSNQHYQYVTSAMKGENGYEVFPLNSGLSIKAEVGDIFCKKRSGSYQNSHCDVIYKVENNIAFIVGGNISETIFTDEITLENGFVNNNVRTSYQLLVKKTNNKYYKGVSSLDRGVNLTGSYDSVPTGENADYWSLIAVCSLENNTPQGRSDVAQSIYNRLLSGVYKGKSIKELIIADIQYEPVGRAKQEFRQINSKDTAVKAFMKSKNVGRDYAIQQIEETEKALNNVTLVQSSKTFIGGRTDFYSITLKDKEPYKTTLANAAGVNVTRDNQIFGWFVGPDSIKYGNTNPPAADKPDFSNVT